jgi:hypothetical protein
MKKTIIITVLFIANLFVSCSSDGGGEPDLSTITLTTTTPSLSADQLSFTSGGTASIKLENSENFTYGICFNNSPNPTISNSAQYASEANDKTFYNTVLNISFGTTYYVRAFVLNDTTNEVKYGNEVSITIPLTLNTGIVKGISANSFNVDITVGDNLGSNVERGVVFGSGQNPSVGDNSVEVVQISSNGAGTFNIPVETGVSIYVIAATNYYLRSYVRINGALYYGNQVTFKTAGYLGGSGGYVFYDKGEITNGWRYLEAYTDFLRYNNNTAYFNWDCTGNFVPGISNDIGAGYENSVIIKNACNYNNVAPAVCLDQNYNGQSRWFVPSLEELKTLYRLRPANVFNFGQITLMSSSQAGNTTAWAVYFSGNNAGTSFQVSKLSGSSYQVWPIRRF